MTAPSSIVSGVGFRNAVILALDANGIINAAGTAAYEGITLSGAKTMTINDPEPRQIVHVGDDRPIALDVLPPTEPITGEITSAKQNNTLDTAVQNVNEVTKGEAKFYPIGTDQRGNENQVCILGYRQATDDDPASGTFGKRTWQFRLFPRAYLIPRENSFDDNPEARSYTLRPQFATKYPWGVTFAAATEGVTQAQGFRGISEKKPKIVAYVTNGVATSFALPTAASSTAKVASWLVTPAGVGAVSTATTLGTASLAYTIAPTTGTLVVFYETA